MKLKYIFIAAAALVLGACEKSAISPLDGVYQKPEDFISDEVRSYSIDKLDNVRCFNVELANAGSSLNLKLYGGKYYLEPMTYSSANADAIKKGFYLVGEGGSTYTSGGSAVALDHGGITVSADGENYAFTGTVWLADGRIVKIDSKATLVYEPDPEAVALVKVLSAQSNLANGQPTLTMQLATEDVSSTFDPSTWQTTYSGDGNYLALDIYSADGYLHEGTYKPCAVGGTVGEGEYGIGYDTVFWGQQVYNWGTCWWAVDNGATSAVKVLAGDITVKQNGSVWTIEMNNDVAWCKFEGEIPALTGEVGTSYVNLADFLSFTDYFAQYQNPMVGIELATSGVYPEFSFETYQTTWHGEGNHIKLELYSADGKLAPGEYKACAEGGIVGEGEFGIGYKGQWGDSGTCWTTVSGGAASTEYVQDGKVVVEQNGDTYTITLESSVANVKYSGKLSIE